MAIIAGGKLQIAFRTPAGNTLTNSRFSGVKVGGNKPRHKGSVLR